MKSIHAKKQKTSAGRFTAAIIAIVVEVVFILLMINVLVDIGIPIHLAQALERIVAICFAIYLVGSGRHLNSSVRVSWLILMLVFPFLGLVFYIITHFNFSLSKMGKKYQDMEKLAWQNLSQEPSHQDALKELDPASFGISHYLETTGEFPVSAGNTIRYYPDALSGFNDQLEDIKKAKKFIFMEYFIVEDAPFFRDLCDLLEQKVKEGVEVRFMYDDLGSAKVFSRAFTREMNQRGIQCRIYNPISFVASVFINNRNHRKITVIDGKVGYTGGYNLAEEYFNYIERFGYWKDTGIRMEGPAVDTLTALFLTDWNSDKKATPETDVTKFFGHSQIQPDAVKNCFIQPYGDSPLQHERYGENVYMDIAGRANKYLYIATPYLIVTDEMVNALSLAAKRGVDVRILTPGIPDKKMVFMVTQSYYPVLLRNGVKIYEYTPGFVHAKMFLADDEIGVIGTVNMDFRSLYHHFENAVLLFHSPILKDMYQDFEEMFAASTEIFVPNRRVTRRIKQCLLRLAAPLL